MYKILVVEDDPSIVKVIEGTLLLEEGYELTICSDGIEPEREIANQDFHLILLDVMLPGKDGFSIMKDIANQRIPVIFMTAKGDVQDRIKGLKLGADDYVVKPFDSMELLARIEAVLRRYHTEEERILKFKDITIDEDKHVVTQNNTHVELTTKEFDMLVYFIRHKDIVIRKDRLMAQIWGFDYMGQSRTVDTHIQNLRRKLNIKEELATIPKIGYYLNSQDGQRM